MRAGRWVGGWVGRSVGRSYSHSEMEQVLGENAHSLVEEDRFVSNMHFATADVGAHSSRRIRMNSGP